jgi:hypothetical protein
VRWCLRLFSISSVFLEVGGFVSFNRLSIAFAHLLGRVAVRTWSPDITPWLVLTWQSSSVILSSSGPLKSDSSPFCRLLRELMAQGGPSHCLCPFGKCQVSGTRYTLHQELVLSVGPRHKGGRQARAAQQCSRALSLSLGVLCLARIVVSHSTHTCARLDGSIKPGASNSKTTIL